MSTPFAGSRASGQIQRRLPACPPPRSKLVISAIFVGFAAVRAERPLRVGTQFPMSATATATEPEQAPDRLAGFVPIHVVTLRSTKSDAVDLFVQYESQLEPVLYCR